MLALAAGCDLVLLCNQSVDGGAMLDDWLDTLAAAQDRGEWQANALSEARRLHLLPSHGPLPWDELMLQPAYMHALGILP